jgi:hypothetical protein
MSRALRDFRATETRIHRIRPTPRSATRAVETCGWPQEGGSWDWEHEPPQVLVWRGTRFVPLPRAELSAIISETAAERAPLWKPQ